MIENFEEQTHDLTDYELQLVPIFVKGLQTKIGIEKAVTAKSIEALMSLKYKVSGPRIRKIINHIRNRGLVEGLIAGNAGYYISTDVEEIKLYIQSLESRESSIKTTREGMEAYLRRLKLFNNEG